MQQHAKSVDGGVSSFARRSEKRCFEGNVNDVHCEGSSRQLVKCDVELTLAEHSLAGGVDYHRGAVQSFVALFPRQSLYRAREIFRDPFRALEGAIDDPDLFDARLRKGVANGERAAACADHDTGTSVGAPAGLLFFDALDETVTIVVGARERPVGSDNHTTDRAYALRDSVDFIDPLHRLLLVRECQIATGESERV